MDNIRVSKWLPFLEKARTGWGGSNTAKNLGELGTINPYYKQYTNAWITRIIPFSTDSGDRCDTHYNVTESLPFVFDCDITLIMNPFREVIHQPSPSTTQAIGLTLSMNYRNSPTGPWTQGIHLLEYTSNHTTSTSFDITRGALVIDSDEVDHDNAPLSQEEFGSGRTDDGKLIQDHNGTTYSKGTYKGKELRLSIGVVNNATYGKCGEYPFHIMLIPHKARGKKLT